MTQQQDIPTDAGEVSFYPTEDWDEKASLTWTNVPAKAQGERFFDNGRCVAKTYGIVGFGPILRQIVQPIGTGPDDIKTTIITEKFICRDAHRNYYLRDFEDNLLVAFKDGHLMTEHDVLFSAEMGRFEGESERVVDFLEPSFYDTRIRPFIPADHPIKVAEVSSLSTGRQPGDDAALSPSEDRGEDQKSEDSNTFSGSGGTLRSGLNLIDSPAAHK